MDGCQANTKQQFLVPPRLSARAGKGQEGSAQYAGAYMNFAEENTLPAI
jgi:hypothetical protein